MDWFSKLFVIWLVIDLVVIATAWYLNQAIRPKFPDWWREIVADDRRSAASKQWEKAELGRSLEEVSRHEISNKYSGKAYDPGAHRR